MTRLRTGNNRRRARELKQGGLYRLGPPPRFELLDLHIDEQPVDFASIRRWFEEDIARTMRLAPIVLGPIRVTAEEMGIK